MRELAVELLKLAQEEEGPRLDLMHRPEAVRLCPPLSAAALVLLLRVLDEAELLEVDGVSGLLRVVQRGATLESESLPARNPELQDPEEVLELLLVQRLQRSFVTSTGECADQLCHRHLPLVPPAAVGEPPFADPSEQ
eukprot:9497186-Alexandrium_andersonii.AAC.1